MHLSIILLVCLVPIVNSRPRYWVLSNDREVYYNLANPPADFNPLYSKEERTGHCPAYKPRICSGRPVGHCQYDDDCRQGSKCCKDYCYRYKVCIKIEMEKQVTEAVTSEATSVTPAMTTERNDIPTGDVSPRSTETPRIPDEDDYYYVDIDDVMTLPPDSTTEREETSETDEDYYTDSKTEETTPDSTTEDETTVEVFFPGSKETTFATEEPETADTETEKPITEADTTTETDEDYSESETEETIPDYTTEDETTVEVFFPTSKETTLATEETETVETATEETTTGTEIIDEYDTEETTTEEIRTEKTTTGTEEITSSDYSESGSGDSEYDDEIEEDYEEYKTTPRSVSEFEFEESTTARTTVKHVEITTLGIIEETDYDSEEYYEEFTEASTRRETEEITTKAPRTTPLPEFTEGSGSGDRIDDTEYNDDEDEITGTSAENTSIHRGTTPVFTGTAAQVTTQPFTRKVTTEASTEVTEEVESSGSGDKIDDTEDDYEEPDYDEAADKPRVEKEIEIIPYKDEDYISTYSSKVEEMETEADLQTTITITTTESVDIEVEKSSTEYFDYGSEEEVRHGTTKLGNEDSFTMKPSEENQIENGEAEARTSEAEEISTESILKVVEPEVGVEAEAQNEFDEKETIQESGEVKKGEAEISKEVEEIGTESNFETVEAESDEVEEVDIEVDVQKEDKQKTKVEPEIGNELDEAVEVETKKTVELEDDLEVPEVEKENTVEDNDQTEPESAKDDDEYYEEYDETLVPESKRGKEFVIPIEKTKEKNIETLDNNTDPPPMSRELEVEEKEIVETPNKIESDTETEPGRVSTEITKQNAEDEEAKVVKTEAANGIDGVTRRVGFQEVTTPRFGLLTTWLALGGIEEKERNEQSAETNKEIYEEADDTSEKTEEKIKNDSTEIHGKKKINLKKAGKNGKEGMEDKGTKKQKDKNKKGTEKDGAKTAEKKGKKGTKEKKKGNEKQSEKELKEKEIDIDEATEKVKNRPAKPDEGKKEKKIVPNDDELEEASGSGSGDDTIPDEYGDDYEEEFSGDKVNS